MQTVPSTTQILVIGGGPSGSFAAAALAREGFQVTLLEAAKFPRYHIGESLLPSVKPLLQFIGAEEKVQQHGFCPKPGAAAKFTQHKREGYIDFVRLDFNNGAWNVIRSEFDEILLRHASESGAAVFEEARVVSVLFEDDNPTQRPIAARYVQGAASFSNTEAHPSTISFEYLVDASGRTGIMSQRHLKNRRFNRNLDNVACWGYWTGCMKYSPGTRRENAPWFEALQDESGWAWFIPLHDRTVSVGIVQNRISTAAKKRHRRESNETYTLKDYYLDELKLVPGVLSYIGERGKFVEVGKDGGPGVQQAADFSYSATAYAGAGYRLVGDASAFIDPFFSSGVHLALNGGLAAAATISSSIRGDASEQECAKWHDARVGTSYTRFLLVVLSAYKQMRAQQEDVLSDVNEDNFDRAFELFRPVISGTADVGKMLTEDELQKTIDFMRDIFAPTDPEMHAAVHARLDPKLFSSQIMRGAELDQMIDPTDEDARNVLARENARKPVDNMYDSRKGFTSEPINGWTVRLERGKLGMVPAAVPA